MRSKKTLSGSIMTAIMIALLLVNCNSNRKEFVEAEKLAKQHCQSCHLFPSPHLLDKKSWVYGVLPAMGPRLGIRASNGIMYKYNAPKGTLPDQAAMSQADWEKIVRYFYTLAPDTLKGESPAILKNLTQFSYKETSFRDTRPPVTTQVKIDPQNHSVYICDGAVYKLKIFDHQLTFKGEAPTHLAASSVSLDSFENGTREATILGMGILSPSDVVSGRIQKLAISKELIPTVTEVPGIDSLMRPVFLEHRDIDEDGVKDYLVSEFGNFYGDLAWFKAEKDNNYRKIILRDKPGAMQTRFVDFNNDGKNDVFALMAQADEGIFLYENKSNGKFEEKTLLRFAAVNGSTSFDLADFNSDGYLDIVYTAGDNSDYSKTLKPYHGVYIFLNDGKWNFGKEEYFFPINGCFKVIARDFDKDGDQDLATISFFADLKNKPEEGFVYFKNNGNLNFEAQTFPQVMSGHWLTMDADDLDGDGDVDIVLGNMSVGPLNIQVENKWASGPSFILLENKFR